MDRDLSVYCRAESVSLHVGIKSKKESPSWLPFTFFKADDDYSLLGFPVCNLYSEVSSDWSSVLEGRERNVIEAAYKITKTFFYSCGQILQVHS